jgi:hypothetical protein
MSDWPETRDELISRFCDPDHNNYIWVEDRDKFTWFVDQALSRPDPVYSYLDKELKGTRPNMDVATFCNRIHDHQFFLNDRYGWIDPEGYYWPCSYTSHDGSDSTFANELT